MLSKIKIKGDIQDSEDNFSSILYHSAKNIFLLLFHSSHSSSPKASTSIPSSPKLSPSPKNQTFHFSKFSHSSHVSLLTGIDGSHVDSSHRATALTLNIL